MADDTVLAWLDVETSKLEPKVRFWPDPWGGRLLEVACILTDIAGNELAEPFTRLVYHGRVGAWWARRSAPEVVQQMHDKTGLWGRLRDGAPVETVDAELLAYIRTRAPLYRQARVAGSSVTLDLKFLARFLPATYDHVHYRSIDVSALRTALVSNGKARPRKAAPSVPAHEALADIRESVAEYRHLLSQVKWRGPDLPLAA